MARIAFLVMVFLIFLGVWILRPMAAYAINEFTNSLLLFLVNNTRKKNAA